MTGRLLDFGAMSKEPGAKKPRRPRKDRKAERHEPPVNALVPLGRAEQVHDDEPPPRDRLGEKVAAALDADNELPHEFLLRVMRGGVVPQDVINTRTGEMEQVFSIPTFEQRIEAAKAAAPYYAPKLAVIEVWKGMTDAELDRLIEEVAPEAGLVLGDARTGEAREGEGVPAAQEHAVGAADPARLQPGDGPGAPAV